MTVRILYAAALSAALVVSACQKKAEPPADAAPAAPAAAPASGEAAAPAAPPALTDAELPAECHAFLDTVEACAVKMGQERGPADAEVFRTAARDSRADWAGIPTREELVANCKQAKEVFEAADNGC